MMIPDDPALPQDIVDERERRQRSVRFLMMFLLMLLLMDGEEQSQRRRSYHHVRGKRSKSDKEQALAPSMFMRRQQQDKLLEMTTKNHPRYKTLVEKNEKDFESEVRAWAEQQLDLEKDEFEKMDVRKDAESIDPAEKQKLWHFPFNATGFYRGEWARDELISVGSIETHDQKAVVHPDTKVPKNMSEEVLVDVKQLKQLMVETLRRRKEGLGVFLLPPGFRIKLQNSTFPEPKPKQKQRPLLLRTVAHSATDKEKNDLLRITLTKPSGRAAFQLYQYSVPATKEISLLNGFVKLYDSNTAGYSTRRDILLRVTGVIVHSIGQVSLVSNTKSGRSALVVDKEQFMSEHRKLQEILSSTDSDSQVEELRAKALKLFAMDPYVFEKKGEIMTMNPDATEKHARGKDDGFLYRRLTESIGGEAQDSRHMSNSQKEDTAEKDTIDIFDATYIFPYPYAIDDQHKIERMLKDTPATRSMPPREQLLESNAGKCEFELNFKIDEEASTLGEWRRLVGRKINDVAILDPSHRKESTTGEIGENKRRVEVDRKGKSTTGSMSSKNTPNQALAMTMNGKIHSFNCNFSVTANVTAVRTNWERSQTKAINYSFYMMLTCLTQIVLLLRQLLHTQTQSAATKVSLLGIGWQTVLDALLCLGHIYLSLAVQPLFTAFASVAFFKLLIFCVIEMKYMAIIIQARNANNGGNTIELLRRQIAMLHLRFYVALLGVVLLFFYLWESYKTMYVLFLYSFWVPQIIQNIITEAKRPLHPYYIHGMSFTRLIAPLYIFAIQNNFLKEVYPDSQTNTLMCELLIIWVGIQSGVLEAQGRFGARFFIPARFLPPKFDYSRPIPDSLLPAGSQDMTPSEALRNERGPANEVRSVIASDTSPLKATGARNRIKGSRANRSESSMTTETVPAPISPPSPSFDCVICYSSIDIGNRGGYMLAPCDHLFHRECLEQWMEVKMECPICREDLPSI